GAGRVGPGGHQRDIRGCTPDPAQSEWGVLTEHRWWNLRRRDGCGDGVDLGLYPQRVASLPLALRAGSRSGRRDADRRLTRGQAGGTTVAPAIALLALARYLVTHGTWRGCHPDEPAARSTRVLRARLFARRCFLRTGHRPQPR